MVQSGQLSGLADSGSRVFEEQPLLEESFTIHLGASDEFNVIFFLVILFIFNMRRCNYQYQC